MRKGAKPGDQVRLGKTLPKMTCVNCGKTKGPGSFPKRGGPTYEKLKASDPRRYDSQCKLCKKPVPAGTKRKNLKEPVRKYGTNRKKKKTPKQQRSNQTRVEYKIKVRTETRIKSMLYLSEHGCEECGERDPRKLEYDHKNPSDKKRIISRLIVDGYSWASSILRAEIRKCRVLCANCHRKHTIEQQGYYATPEVVASLAEIADAHGFDV
jgi:hypothetical protein